MFKKVELEDNEKLSKFTEDILSQLTEWISTKDDLPRDRILVMAKNPHISSLSWLDGVDELGKRMWCHDKWDHADQFVTHWRYLTDNEVVSLLQAKDFYYSTWFRYGCSVIHMRDIIRQNSQEKELASGSQNKN